MGELLEFQNAPVTTKPGINVWRMGLEKLAKRIRDLSDHTERDFLLIGNNLQNFASKASEITGVAFSASSVMCGDEIQGAVKGLEAMIDQMEGLFQQADEASASNLEGLRMVGRDLRYVLDEHQTVIKLLGKAYRNTDGVSGATILGDGSVALILDVPSLIRLTERENKRSR